MSLAASLITSGVEVAAQDGDCDLVVAGLQTLLTSECDSDHARELMLRAVLETLRDAADGAREVHEDAPDVGPNTIGRMRRFAAAMSAALKEIS